MSRTVVIVLMFLCIGAFFIISNNNLHLAKHEEASAFYGLYYQWMGSIFDNVKSISGYVIKSEWLPVSNATNGSG